METVLKLDVVDVSCEEFITNCWNGFYFGETITLPRPQCLGLLLSCSQNKINPGTKSIVNINIIHNN